MNDKNLINSFNYDSNLGYDNLALNEHSPNIIKTTLIMVKPRESVDESTRVIEIPLESKIDTENSPMNLRVIKRDSTSSDSIEELDIRQATMPTSMNHNDNVVEPTKPKHQINSMSQWRSSKHSKEQKEGFMRKRSINVFDEELLLSDVIKNPISGIIIPDLRTDLRKFLLTPPPKNVVIKCQMNKTNEIDKTLMFTNFIFSLQMSDPDTEFKRELEMLMIAHPNRNPKKFAYIISSDPSDISSNSNSTIGILRSNFLGKRFNIFSRSQSLISNSSENFNDFDDENSNLDSSFKNQLDHIGVIFYKNSRFGSRKPRKIDVAIPYWKEDKENYDLETYLPKDRQDIVEANEDSFTKLENVEPTYDEERKCYTLDFGGRAKEISVKNFALTMKCDGIDKRVYQFGKCKHHYIVDFTYPLCALQAFAIGLSCCQRKIGIG